MALRLQTLALALELTLMSVPLALSGAPTVTLQGSAQAGARLELAVSGAPATTNPFDPDQIRVDGTLLSPSGGTVTLPGFWHQPYTRALVNGSEALTPSGSPGWRLRFWPSEAGHHQLTLHVITNGVESGTPVQLGLEVAPPGPAAHSGSTGLNADRSYFQTGDGRPLPLIVANICWHHNPGTFDYDAWFTRLAAEGGNFARIWMAPWAFGIESEPATLTRFRLDRAWQLDRVLQLAESKGIHLMLCLEYHGMFATQPDATFGGNDNWKLNPYNLANSGPCTAPDDFFTSAAAQSLYKKRLRYLIARYSSSPNLLAWEFFNEIDNVYNPANGALNAAHVAAWHGVLGSWLKTNDPFHHLVTTSLTGSSDRSDIWSLPSLDFSQFHSYGTVTPATGLASIATRMRKAYGKPMLVGEFGMDFRGWLRAQEDPYLRGFRQALWGAAIGGTPGTAMSWWWEDLQADNVYVLHQSLRSILSRTHWGEGSWTPMEVEGVPQRPTTVGDPQPTAGSFTATLVPSQAWGAMPSGQLAVVDADSAASAASSLDGFVHGTAHPDLRTPFKLSAWLEAGARITAHVNSVSTGARLALYVDGVSVLSTNLPDKDGKYDPFANEYNIDIPASLSAGKHLVEIRNTGADWFFLDWVRLEKVRPSLYPGGWQPALVAVGLQGRSESLLYVASPSINWPANATNPAPPVVTGRFVTATNWPAGVYGIRWFQPTNGVPIVETEATTRQGRLQIPVPEFAEDLVGIIARRPSLRGARIEGDRQFRSELDADPGSFWEVESSVDLVAWRPEGALTNTPVPLTLTLGNAEAPYKYYRVAQPGP